MAPPIYPSPPIDLLMTDFVGKRIEELVPPAHILDLAVVKKNCRLMLETTSKLGLKFRAHVKTHKTIELTKLQVGENSNSVRLVTSTLAELELLGSWLDECVKDGRLVNVIYGLPIRASVIPRLAALARTLGEGAISLFVDDPAQVSILDNVANATWPGKISIFVNIDVGYHREGVSPHSTQLADIAKALATAKKITLAGLYTHAGHSYGSNGSDEALKYMSEELEGLEEAATAFVKLLGDQASQVLGTGRLILSLGATPTVTSAQALLEDTARAVQYRNTLVRVNQSFEVEFHAGNYAILDMQQLATRARPSHFESNPMQSLLTPEDVAVRTLVDVASLYLDRADKPEALIAGGSLMLGREPCKSYPGWAVVTPWPAKSGSYYNPEGQKTGWIVGRISQEHGILTWEGQRAQMRQLEVGQKLLVWPNHACIAGAHFGWYLIVDSGTNDPEIVRDVWIRCRGW